MQDLPAGTVTFLFTDIEGSTALLKQFGHDRYDEALADHGRLLRAAIAAHDGRVVDTQGDSFFVPYSNLWNYDFFSARIGCQVFQPAYTVMDLAALCIRP
jgi:GGDEF domain-containing protein